ncbi:MAG TPA: alanine--tRNA ligase-related protein, partial [Terrimicrobiaceae bacterium]|nr:alanine--tRNA ligase-related protein [Terrimicrobiaceae bacterium]
MTSAEIRTSFLEFFREKKHTIVPSSSLMPDAPNLLFTNAGMNQFVPIFLGEVKSPYSPGRAVDTQKCIRAGGKHNDLEDVGLDTYHHTFFEMLGNWSFGDYFKREAIAWAWELIVERWKFPPSRLYATVYCPHMDEDVWKQEMNVVENAVQSGGTIINSTDYAHVFHNAIVSGKKPFGGIIKWEPSDTEAAQFWFKLFEEAQLNPLEHIIPGNKKDNFWMMGDTGPCGPCSELHVDLTAAGETRGRLVNQGSPDCIEIWNLVFIQYNANPDGTFSPLPAKHVDTGMGFERVTSIIQGTNGFSDFSSAKISNYETDIFRPIFDEIEKLSGKKYASTLPGASAFSSAANDLGSQQAADVAFRVIADHIRTLSFAIADGIQPGNTDRSYVLRRILRRAIRYGRTLGFREPFFYKLVAVLAHTMGDVFPEIRKKQARVEDVLRSEEEAFNKTLDRGIEEFNTAVKALAAEASRSPREVA